MTPAALGLFEAGFASWSRMLSISINDDVRLSNFTSACHEAAACVANGLDKPVAVDTLLELAESHGLTKQIGREKIETIIVHAFEPPAFPDPSFHVDEPLHPDPEPRLRAGDALVPNAEALKTMTFEAIKYVVPGIIVEGLSLFAGKPKIGKSWLLLHASVAVARGGFTLGEIHCPEGDVLYCALEDNERRLQSRLTKLLGIAQPWPARWFYKCQMPRLASGGLNVLKDWIKSVPHPRLIVIDTLAMVRAPRKREESNYDADYGAVLELRALANATGVAIVLVHHLRKAESDDAFDTVSGTLGLTGAPDSVLVLKRDSSGTIILHGRGRDLPEIEMAMSYDRESCLWRTTGDAADVRRSNERTAVLEAIEEAGEPIGPNDIAAATGMRAANVRFLLGRLGKEGAIEKAGYGKYRAVKLKVVASV